VFFLSCHQLDIERQFLVIFPNVLYAVALEGELDSAEEDGLNFGLFVVDLILGVAA
jgi:hypothetical protein